MDYNISMNSIETSAIKYRVQASAFISIMALCLIPAKATDLSIASSNKRIATTFNILHQQNRETSSDQLITKLEQLQTDVIKNSIAISLEEAIALGVKNNPDLEIAFTEIQMREWELIHAKRKWYPTLKVYGGAPFTGYTWSTFVENNYSKGAATRTTKNRSKTYNINPRATISWDFLDLTRQPEINAAEDSLRRQKLLFNVSARNLILRIQQSYFSIQSSAQLIDSFKGIYAINKQQLRILSERQGIGMTTVLDVEQVKSQLFAQLNQLVGYTQDYITQTGELAKNLALEPGQLAIPTEKAKPQGVWTQSLSQTIDEALEQREEILANIAAAEAAEWNGVAALRQYLPIFSLKASGDLSSTNGYQDILVNEDPNKNIRDGQRWNAAIGIEFQWNIFDGGLNAASAETRFSRSRKFVASASKTKLQVTQEVQSSYGAMETSQVGIKSAEQAYRSAEIAQEAARARFDVGVGDIFSVVQAINLLSNAATQKSVSTLKYNLSIAQLYRYSANWPINSKNDAYLRIKTNRTIKQP